MKDSIFGDKMGWPRYFMPRTGFSLFGSLYFLFTFQTSLFVLHLILEAACIVFAAFLLPSLLWQSLLFPRLFIPFLMGRWRTMNNLNGAWRIDWIVPVLHATFLLLRFNGYIH